MSAATLTGSPLYEHAVPAAVKALNPESRGLRHFTLGGCNILVCREPRGRLRWHLSISHPERYPTWDEIHDARYRLLPDHVQVAMMLPPRSEYVNVHGTCFHLWEIDEATA